MEAKGRVFAWVTILLASEIVAALTAMFIAAGGAVTADTSINLNTAERVYNDCDHISDVVFATHLKPCTEELRCRF
jgi:hypothetical protein